MAVSDVMRKRMSRKNIAARKEQTKKKLIYSLQEPCPHGNGLFTKMIEQTRFASILEDDGDKMPKLTSLANEFKKYIRIDQEYSLQGVNHKKFDTMRRGTTERFNFEPKKVEHWKLHLLFCENGETYPVQWIEVKESTLYGAGLGVYINKDVKKGERIGFYFGKQVRKGSKVSEYAMKSKDWGLVDPKRGFGDTDNPVFYVGAHMMNDPTFGLKKGTNQWKKARLKANVTVYDNLFVVADRDIKKGSELFLLYHPNDRPVRRKPQPRRKRAAPPANTNKKNGKRTKRS
jgi:hypothetical protein